MRPSAVLTTLAFTPPTISSPHPPPSEILQCSLPTPKHPTPQKPSTCLASPLPNPSTWHPWSHAPYCLPSSQTPYCVFTNAASPRPHGLSIITTADFASDALQPFLQSFDKSFFAPRKLLLPRPYAVREIPGKGKGAVATRKIQKGMAVLVDYASLLAEVEYPPGVDVRELLEVAVERLPERVGGVEGLARRGGREGMSEVEDVVLTNSVAVGVAGREFMGLFADLARFNHACKPNAFIHFSQTTLAMTVWSARDIGPGEEITITYSPAGMTSNERQEVLAKVWGFKCTCPLCTALPETLKASDANREKVRLLQDKVVELAQRGKFHKAIETAERMFSLIEEEAMTEQMGGMYEIPARLYYKIGNLEKALEYTLKARHEIDAYGLPGEMGKKKIDMLERTIKQIKEKMEGRGRKNG